MRPILPLIATGIVCPGGQLRMLVFQHAGPLQNFTMKGASNTDLSGATGEIENSGGNLQFSGGNYGQTAVYKGGNPPTISFIDDNGEEQFFCQLGQ